MSKKAIYAATLAIGAEVPHIGHYKPGFQPPPPVGQPDLTFNLSEYYGLLPSQVNGVWTIEVIDDTEGSFDPNDPPLLVDASLIATARANPGTNRNGLAGDDVVVTTSLVPGLGLLEGPYDGGLFEDFFTASFARGISAAPTIASDNTVGSFLGENQGRLYIALTDLYAFSSSTNVATPGTTTNTDVFLLYSDNGGLTWQRQGASLK